MNETYTAIAVTRKGTQDAETFRSRASAVAWAAAKCRGARHVEAVVIENSTGKAQKFINGRFYKEPTA
jgi:hypothetical protein